jgi:hypothetical protein
MAIETKRRLCGTIEAARIYGCTTAHIRKLSRLGDVWSEKISDRVTVYDADQVRRLACERSKARAQGKLAGRAPQGFNAA